MYFNYLYQLEYGIHKVDTLDKNSWNPTLFRKDLRESIIGVFKNFGIIS